MDKPPTPAAILSNPTLHPRALTDAERALTFKWHCAADSPRSSQVFCISAFGTLRSIASQDSILETLFQQALPPFPRRRRARRWDITLEAENPDLLSERGANQPTSIDVLCVSSDEVICIEAKFATDAAHGFGSCSQFPKACAGYRGPGSDVGTHTSAWCRLENWERGRAPRNYWSVGKRWFQPGIFAPQAAGDVCPLRGSNYQLMRNFLFAACLAEREGKSHFGVLTIAPRRFAPLLSAQVADFRRDVLRDAYVGHIGFVDYEVYADMLDASGSSDAADLSAFLRERVATVIG